ncbi:2568_t:CDS:1, partial [Ambispora leptoticha]
WLKLKDPFLAKVESVKKIIEQFNNNIAAEDAKKVCIREIDSISTDSQCPVDTKTNIESWEESDFKTQYTETLNILNELSIELAKEKFFHVLELISLLKSLCQPSSCKFSIDVFNNILQRYIKRLPFDQAQFKSCRSLPVLVSLLAKLNYDPQLCKLHQKLDDISGSGFDNEKAIINFFNLISNEKIENEKFWLNSRVIYLIRNSPIAISRIAMLKSYVNISSYMPHDIKKRLNKHRNEILQQENFEMPETLNDIDEAIKVFKRISIIQDIEPEAFRLLMENSISKNEELKKSFKSADALFYWNEEEKFFDQHWDIQTIKDAYSKLEQWKRSSNAGATKPNIPINFLDLDCKNINENIKKCNKKEINVHKNWRPIMGKTISMIASKDYVEVRAIISTPKIETTQEIACVSQVLPYLMQKVKMWG